ncbi:hypothetical protein F5144DRAFT_561141 [Chaetomium tenue]|uniref:Uncharacterized protein n=1 Tax=Chaetomium tenue TaxID=1854479 RepID=A0ACB7PG95_9PEZI|nr:hypothetical protein F5144DRAFT_561141 [Chaetomium globosum]
MDSPLVGWQNADTTRGTFSIIKTCMATIFACTWTIQHLNVPAAHDNEWRRFFRVCKWMLFTILLPEFILAHAIMELALAVKFMKRIKMDPLFPSNLGQMEVVYPAWLTLLVDPPNRWPAIRSLLGRKKLVDGLVEEEQQRRPSITPTSQSQGQKHSSHRLGWTLTHTYFANMGGFVFSPPVDGLDTSEPAPYPLTAESLAEYSDYFEFPKTTEGDIKDKSKTDGLAKAFSVFQISHLVLSLVVRRSQGLPSAQLEILTLAFAICGVATYAVYWYKPKDVAVPISVRTKSGGSEEPWGVLRLSTFDSFWRVVTNDKGHRPRPLGRVPNDNIPINRTGSAHTATFVLAFVSAAFASLHAIAWDFDFPTATEATIWHVCTILTITLPPLGLLGIPLSQSTWRQGSPWDFLSATIRVLRELCWHLESPQEKMEVNYIRRNLDDLYNMNLFQPARAYSSAQAPYGNLLRALDEASTPESNLRRKMLDFVDKKGTFQNRPDLDLPPGYSSNLHRLFRLIDGHGSKKMVEEVARIGVFPRRSLLPTAFNMWLVYITMGLYCAARLVLVAVGLSSLRAMPQGVYKSTWADYFPAI